MCRDRHGILRFLPGRIFLVIPLQELAVHFLRPFSCLHGVLDLVVGAQVVGLALETDLGGPAAGLALAVDARVTACIIAAAAV